MSLCESVYILACVEICYLAKSADEFNLNTAKWGGGRNGGAKVARILYFLSLFCGGSGIVAACVVLLLFLVYKRISTEESKNSQERMSAMKMMMLVSVFV